MRNRRAGLEVVAVCVLAAGVIGIAPRVARACSAPMDVRHRIAWTADGSLLALADPEGRVVRIAPAGTGGEVLAGAARFAHRYSDFTRDGRGLVVIDEQGSDTGDCSPVSVTIARATLADGTKAAAGRAFDVAGISAIRVSPSGSRAALVAATFEDQQVRIFDLARARAVRRLPGTEALWLDDDRLAVMRETGNIHVVRIADRSLVQVGPVPRGSVERHLVPGDAGPTGFTFVEKTGNRWSIVRVRLDGPQPVLEPHAWPHAERPVSVNSDGRRFAAIDERGRHVVVGETATARFVLSVESPFVVTQAALSPDGARLGLASHEVPTTQEDDDAFGDASAFQPTAVHVVDLAGARVAASWGAPARLIFPVFRVSGRMGRPPAENPENR
jgi:hypothetical protein